MKPFKEFFLESNESDKLSNYLAHQHLKHWNDFVKRGGDYKSFGKLSTPLDSKFHPLRNMIYEITENGYPEQYNKFLSKTNLSGRWYSNLQKNVISKVKTILDEERQRKSYGMEYMYPELSSEVYENVNESNILKEYRHNLADGTPTPSLQAHNGKNPNILDKKNLHTVGPYKKKVEKLNVAGSILTFPELEEVGIKDIMNNPLPSVFRNVKNSRADVQVYKNKDGMIVGRVIKASPGLGK